MKAPEVNRPEVKLRKVKASDTLMPEGLIFVFYWVNKDLRLFRRGQFGGCNLSHVPIGFDLLSLERLFLFTEDVFLSHSDLEALVESTSLAETSVGYIHPTSFVVGTFEVVLQAKQKSKQIS